MANPVSRHLLQDINDPRLIEWVRLWDRFEALIIRLYRQGAAGPGDRLRYRWLRWRLQRGYPRWRPALARYWSGRLAGGERLTADPFQQLLDRHSASAFTTDWLALQLLPAGREAINAYLLVLADEASGQQV